MDKVLICCGQPIFDIHRGYTDIKLSDTDIKLRHTDIKLMNTDIKTLAKDNHHFQFAVCFCRAYLKS